MTRSSANYPFGLILRLWQFRDDNKHMNQFVVHSSLDIVEEVQWISNTMYVIPPDPLPRPNEILRNKSSPP
jgi:Sedlin, N-terminal conserved region